MSSKFKKILVIVIAIAFVVSFGVYRYLDSRIYYNDSDVNGNTVGNLYGDGLYCEYDDIVYFANPNDDDALYSMTVNETEVKKISDDSVYYINVDPHYIYYTRDHNNDESQMSFLNVNTDSLCRITHDGDKITILDDAICSYLALNGNTLYYSHYDQDEATTLYSIGIDGENKEQLFKSGVDPRCTVNGGLYYSGVEGDHYVHCLRLNTGSSTQICSEWTWMPTIEGNKLYFMDLNENNRIACVDLSTGQKTLLSSFGTSDYNVCGGKIFYQSIKGDIDGIYRIDVASGTETLIAEGQYHSINTTSKYVYFIDYYSGTSYHCGLNSTAASVFSPAVELDDK